MLRSAGVIALQAKATKLHVNVGRMHPATGGEMRDAGTRKGLRQRALENRGETPAHWFSVLTFIGEEMGGCSSMK